jgi:hypothetical protein
MLYESEPFVWGKPILKQKKQIEGRRLIETMLDCTINLQKGKQGTRLSAI